MTVVAIHQAVGPIQAHTLRARIPTLGPTPLAVRVEVIPLAAEPRAIPPAVVVVTHLGVERVPILPVGVEVIPQVDRAAIPAATLPEVEAEVEVAVGATLREVLPMGAGVTHREV